MLVKLKQYELHLRNKCSEVSPMPNGFQGTNKFYLI